MSLFDALPAIKNQTAQKPGQFTAQLPIQAPTRLRNRNVTAVLGPTNTGKTYLAIERMLGHESGIIGLPLRLLAREVYNKVVDRVGPEKVALVTGEEKIYPKDARYFICTVEALPNHTNCAFAAIDEVQLASDLDRGHIFTDRILNLRGTQETLLLGAETMRGILERLLPGVNVITRPRMSVLAYTGSKKLTRLPHRSAIVTFSANEVYAIAELIRRQRGGAAVVLGSLSPRTRNKQVELYQNGDVDYLIATDAIGMGLNLDVDHVAFASDSKYDGFQYRPLTAAEIGQIAGRAGRHLRDGTFGVSHAVQPFNDELVQAIESHRFPPVKILQWRNRELDFSTLEDLRHALDVTPDQPGLTRAPPSDDIEALDRLPRDPEVKALVTSPDKVELLWNACRIPDYQNISPGQHSDMVSQIFRFLAKDGRIDEDWFARQVKRADKPVGDIDTLSARIAEVRTWTFVANRADWLEDSWSWQEETRAVENRLSDALHDQLTQRFVDRRTAVLMRQLKEKTMLDAEINDAGDVMVEGHHVGQLSGFRFQPDPTAEGIDAKAVRSAADKILADAISKKAAKAAQSPNEDFTLGSDQSLRWRGEVVARVIAGAELLKPRMLLLSDEQLNGAPRDQIQERLDLWLETHIKTLLKPLFDLKDAENLSGTARGLAFRLSEAYGIVARQEVSEDVRALDQETRAGLRQLGIRFGAFHIFVPQLLKPAPSKLLVDLFVLFSDKGEIAGHAEIPALSAAGRTSVPVDAAFEPQLYALVGFKICGKRAVRIDILERLADIIRPIMSWKPEAPGDKPDGAVIGHGFSVTVDMTSLLGCAGDDFSEVLKALNYRMERKQVEVPEPEAAASDAAETKADETAENTEAQSTPESEAPKTEAEAEPATVDDAAASAEPDEQVLQEANAPDEAVVGEVVVDEAVTGEAVADEPATTETETAEDTPTEPQFVEIWRPQGRGGSRKGAPRRANNQGKSDQNNNQDRKSQENQQQRPSKGKGKRNNKNRTANNNQNSRPAHRSRPVDKPIDPDSPFAALAALKNDLSKK